MPPKTDGASVAKPVLSSNTSAVADGHESRKTGVGAAPAIQMFDFEVFGRVQHVSMRKYTKDFADRVGVVGWVKNTEDGTVIGQAAGVETAMVRFRKWLETKGSPSAAITRAEFSNECIIAQAPFKRFKIDKTPLANGKQHAPRPRKKVSAVTVRPGK